ncbi:TPA: hypothetical protein ACTY4W_005706 [Klebsiella michiganensis]
MFDELLKSAKEAVKISRGEIKEYQSTAYKKDEKTGEWKKVISRNIK